MKFSNQHLDLDLLRQVTTLAAILGSIVFINVANFFSSDGVDMATLSDILFTSVQILPANYAFAIWAPIYIGLVTFGIYQLQPAQRQNPVLQRAGYLLVFACLAQCAWIYLFLARLFPLSAIAMFGMLLPLIGLYQRLEMGQPRVSAQEKWFIDIPISLYLGWITVATVVNVALALYSLNWNGWGIAPSIWAIIMMSVSAAITTVITIQRHDIAYTLVIVWAFVAIAIRQMETPLIAVAGVVMAIALALLSLVVELNLSAKMKLPRLKRKNPFINEVDK
jgi:hypothetical protein